MKTFAKQEDGATMIEFALVAPVFFLMLFAILEFGIVSFVEGAVNTVVSNAGRMGMTGGDYAYLQDPNQPPVSREEFLRFYIKDRLGPFSNMGELTITPITFGSVAGLNSGTGGTSGGFGSGGEVVVYDVTYRWNVLTPLLSYFIGDRQGSYFIHARTVIMNEEF